VAIIGALGPVLEDALGDGRGYLVVFVLLTLAPSVLRAGGPRFHPTDPETWVPFAYFLAGGYAPLVHCAENDWQRVLAREAEAIRTAYFGAIACALVCTLFSREASPPKRQDVEPAVAARTDMDRSALIVAAVAVAMLAGLVLHLGPARLFSMSYVQTYAEERGYGVLVTGWYIAQLCATYLVARVLQIRASRKPIPREMAVAVAALAVLFCGNTLLGRRGPILWLLVSVLLVAHLNRVRLPRIWFGFGAIAIIAYSFLVEGARGRMGEGFDAQLEAALDRVEVVDNPSKIPELENLFDNLVVIVHEKPHLVDYPGESWVSAFFQQVPTVIWSNRPRAMAERYVMWVSPPLARAGGGLAFGAAAEGYVNFGSLGTFLQIGLTTLIFFFGPLAHCLSRARTPLMQALAASLASFAYNQFRGELASVIKVTLSLVAGAATMMMVAEIVRRRAPVARRLPSPRALAP
jgi:hypothetical protein